MEEKELLADFVRADDQKTLAGAVGHVPVSEPSAADSAVEARTLPSCAAGVPALFLNPRKCSSFRIILWLVLLLLALPFVVDTEYRSMFQGSLLVLLVPVVYLLPFLIATARGSERAEWVGILSLFTGWTVVGWIYALVLSVRSSVSQSAKSNLVTGLVLAAIASVLAAVNMLLSYPFFTDVGWVVLTMHWACCNFRLHAGSEKQSTKGQAISGWEALVASAISTGFIGHGWALLSCAFFTKILFAWALAGQAARLLSPLQLSLIAAGAAIMSVVVVYLYSVFTVWVNYKLARDIDGDRMHPPTLLRCMVPGVFFCLVGIWTSFTAGFHYNSTAVSTFLQSAAFVVAYWWTARLLEGEVGPLRRKLIEKESKGPTL